MNGIVLKSLRSDLAESSVAIPASDQHFLWESRPHSLRDNCADVSRNQPPLCDSKQSAAACPAPPSTDHAAPEKSTLRN